jgi:hypothetical protein
MSSRGGNASNNRHDGAMAGVVSIIAQGKVTDVLERNLITTTLEGMRAFAFATERPMWRLSMQSAPKLRGRHFFRQLARSGNSRSSSGNMPSSIL